MQTTIQDRVMGWTKDLVSALEKNYTDRYPESPNDITFSITTGKKYIKIIQDNGGVHAFVNKNTGEVYKPAGWKAPAKHVRYDMRIINQRERMLTMCDWAGGYLYMR